jgi:hypothetical protein
MAPKWSCTAAAPWPQQHCRGGGGCGLVCLCASSQGCRIDHTRGLLRVCLDGAWLEAYGLCSSRGGSVQLHSGCSTTCEALDATGLYASADAAELSVRGDCTVTCRAHRVSTGVWAHSGGARVAMHGNCTLACTTSTGEARVALHGLRASGKGCSVLHFGGLLQVSMDGPSVGDGVKHRVSSASGGYVHLCQGCLVTLGCGWKVDGRRRTGR